MSHFVLMLLCILSVEIFIRSNFLSILNLIIKFTKKANYVITNNSISDHWKEKAIPAYSLKIMKSSLQILLLLLFMFFLFFISDYFINNFLEFISSITGIIESILIAFGYVYVRQLIIK